MQCEYEFTTSSQTWRWSIPLDAPSKRLPIVGQTDLPEWTALTTSRCASCPLNAEKHERCPAAVAVADVVNALSDVASIDAVDVTVTLPERVVKKTTTGSVAARSLLGLLLATSGCPILEEMRPLARHHLPFATEEEFMFRLVGLSLLKSYFAAEDGVVRGVSLNALPEYLQRLKQLNTAFAARLRSACDKDAGPNAMCQLFSLSVGAGCDVEDGLASLRTFLR